MTVWFTSLTIFNRRYALRVAMILALCVAIITTLLFGIISQSTHALAGTNSTISFQGRLLDASGFVVPDGSYNIQFKIYQDGTGTAAGNPDGTLKWTEDYVNNGGTSGVQVKNGYLSVNLGEKTPFGTSIDWNQDTLWLSMNIAGSSASCTTFGSSPCVSDGEMLPMKRLTASPYAINSAQLGGIDASGFIQNTTSPQTGNLNVTGTAQAGTLQGNTNILTPALDSIAGSGTVDIGAGNALTVNIGRQDAANSTVNIGLGSGARVVNIGTIDNNSYVNIQGGGGGVNLNSGSGNVVVKANSPTSTFEVHDATDQTLFMVKATGEISTSYSSTLDVKGLATFEQGLTIQGTGTYLTPGGASLSTAINIPNYTVPAYGSVVSFGLPSTSAATARGLLVADGRTSSHQATIGVLSPDENAIMGLSWDGSNSTGTLANTASSLALQGNGLNLLTATNNSGAANVGIGNAATAGYALDVTGDVNTSTQYRINGVTALTGSALTFGDASAASVNSTSGQSLSLNGSTGVTIAAAGTTSASFTATQVQIGSGSGSGAPTLLTLDKAASAPTVDSSMVGSMYYDTTLGQLQCYEADGWGACAASPDDFITISPEYSNAVMHNTGTGTMTSDLCSDALNINDGSSSQPTICGTDETYNYYNWTSSQVTSQARSIYVTYQLPTSFKGFVSGSTSLMGRTDSSDAAVSYQVYRNNSTTGLTACGSVVSVSTGSQTTWQKGTATSTSDPSTCSFVAGDSIVFKVDLASANNANAYASTLGFAFSNH
jgi:hypothetical protein